MAVAAPPESAGPAHVATVSFLASRTVPAGGFWITLSGGVALARVAQRFGTRVGYGASVAATAESVAMMGPARFGVPFTQALTAPALGSLEGRGVSPRLQFLLCALFRLIQNTIGTVFFIWVIAGGLDAYAGTYDFIGEKIGIEPGVEGTIALNVAGLLAWAVFASAVQVAVYRRGLRRWEEGEPPAATEPEGEPEPPPGPKRPARFDPRAVTVAAVIGFGLLLSSTEWPLLAASAVFLVVAWSVSRPDRNALSSGLVIAAVLAGGAFLFSLGGGLGLEMALRRGSRALLLVATATWLRAAARSEGFREVMRRVLGKLRRLPAATEAARVLDAIGSEGRLLAAGRALGDELSGVRKRPLPVLDAVLGWVIREAGHYRPPLARAAAVLRLRAVDVVLVIAAAVPAAALFL